MIDDRDFYSLLRQQELLLRPNRSSSRIGLHPLTHRGRSLEFSEYREYRPGEDLRDLDWKVFARTDRYYVKQRDSHTPASALLLVDDSASMHFHSEQASLSKLRTALLCAFALAYVLHRQGDALAFRTLSQSQPAVPLRTSRRAFRHLVRGLENRSSRASLGSGWRPGNPRLTSKIGGPSFLCVGLPDSGGAADPVAGRTSAGGVSDDVHPGGGSL